jgi:putative acetyltransferase
VSSHPNFDFLEQTIMSLKSFSADHRVRIRTENIGNAVELRAIREVNETAFAGTEEADLVEKLRRDGSVLHALVAELESTIVGHILFSRMWINTTSELVSAVALAPVAVLPEYQRMGIGQRLIEHGLDMLRVEDERIVIVVGHPSYYPRFGFSAETARLLEAPFPREAFMAMELVTGALAHVKGPVVYPPAFGI